MTKTQRIVRLLSKRKRDLLNGDLTNGICYDGIVNEEVYDVQQFKVAVLLKEVNGSDSSGDTSLSRKDWLYSFWIRHQQAEGEPEVCVNQGGKTYVKEDAFYSPTYRKLCLWLSILFDKLENTYTDTKKYFVNGSVDVATVRKVLHRVAVVNLKKTWGGESTKTESLREYLGNPIIEQTIEQQLFGVDMINPQIVLCGSEDVFNIAYEKFGNDPNDEMIISDMLDLYGKPYKVAKIRNILFISMYHPTYQVGKKDTQFARYAAELFDFALKNI